MIGSRLVLFTSGSGKQVCAVTNKPLVEQSDETWEDTRTKRLPASSRQGVAQASKKEGERRCGTIDERQRKAPSRRWWAKEGGECQSRCHLRERSLRQSSMWLQCAHRHRRRKKFDQAESTAWASSQRSDGCQRARRCTKCTTRTRRRSKQAAPRHGGNPSRGLECLDHGQDYLDKNELSSKCSGKFKVVRGVGSYLRVQMKNLKCCWCQKHIAEEAPPATTPLPGQWKRWDEQAIHGNHDTGDFREMRKRVGELQDLWRSTSGSSKTLHEVVACDVFREGVSNESGESELLIPDGGRSLIATSPSGQVAHDPGIRLQFDICQEPSPSPGVTLDLAKKKRCTSVKVRLARRRAEDVGMLT